MWTTDPLLVTTLLADRRGRLTSDRHASSALDLRRRGRTARPGGSDPQPQPAPDARPLAGAPRAVDLREPVGSAPRR